VDYQGKRIYVCCEACIPEVKANPEKALRTLLEKGQAAIDVPAGSKQKK